MATRRAASRAAYFAGLLAFSARRLRWRRQFSEQVIRFRCAGKNTRLQWAHFFGTVPCRPNAM